jgi:protease-4
MNEVTQPTQQRTSPAVWILVIGLVLGLLIVGSGVAMKIAFSSFTDLSALTEMSSGGMVEKSLNYGNKKSDDKIAVISVNGQIAGDGSALAGTGMVNAISKQLRKATKDSTVKAVVIEMNSPGGGLTASDIIHHEVLAVKAAGKPVVVHVNGLAASGGYYISAPADYIISNPTAMIGSIGVIMMRFELIDLMKKIGVNADPIKSTKMKDLGSGFRPLYPEERQFFLDMIATFQHRFVTIISEGRKIPEAQVFEMASGLIWTADQAKEKKLIDEVGYFETALDKARDLAGLKEAQYFKYDQQLDFEELMKRFSGVTYGGPSAEQMMQTMRENLVSTPMILAQWVGPTEAR